MEIHCSRLLRTHCGAFGRYGVILAATALALLLNTGGGKSDTEVPAHDKDKVSEQADGTQSTPLAGSLRACLLAADVILLSQRPRITTESPYVSALLVSDPVYGDPAYLIVGPPETELAACRLFNAAGYAREARYHAENLATYYSEWLDLHPVIKTEVETACQTNGEKVYSIDKQGTCVIKFKGLTNRVAKLRERPASGTSAPSGDIDTAGGDRQGTIVQRQFDMDAVAEAEAVLDACAGLLSEAPRMSPLRAHIACLQAEVLGMLGRVEEALHALAMVPASCIEHCHFSVVPISPVEAAANNIVAAIDRYYQLGKPRLDKQLSGLVREGLLTEKELCDPWGRPFIPDPCQCCSCDNFPHCRVLMSAGGDGVPGTPDDVKTGLKKRVLPPVSRFEPVVGAAMTRKVCKPGKDADEVRLEPPPVIEELEISDEEDPTPSFSRLPSCPYCTEDRSASLNGYVQAYKGLLTTASSTLPAERIEPFVLDLASRLVYFDESMWAEARSLLCKWQKTLSSEVALRRLLIEAAASAADFSLGDVRPQQLLELVQQLLAAAEKSENITSRQQALLAAGKLLYRAKRVEEARAVFASALDSAKSTKGGREDERQRLLTVLCRHELLVASSPLTLLEQEHIVVKPDEPVRITATSIDRRPIKVRVFRAPTDLRELLKETGRRAREGRLVPSAMAPDLRSQRMSLQGLQKVLNRLDLATLAVVKEGTFDWPEDPAKQLEMSIILRDEGTYVAEFTSSPGHSGRMLVVVMPDLRIDLAEASSVKLLRTCEPASGKPIPNVTVLGREVVWRKDGSASGGWSAGMAGREKVILGPTDKDGILLLPRVSKVSEGGMDVKSGHELGEDGLVEARWRDSEILLFRCSGLDEIAELLVNASPVSEPSGGTHAASIFPPPGDGRIIVYFYTDRPVYRAGQRVFFKGIVRQEKTEFRPEDTGRYEPPSSKFIASVSAKGPRGTIFCRDFEVGGALDAEIPGPTGNDTTESTQPGAPGVASAGRSAGSFWGSFELPQETPRGTITLTVSCLGQTASTKIKVIDFIKSDYKLEFAGDDHGNLIVSAQYAWGTPVGGAVLKYHVLGTDAKGESVLGEDGRTVIAIGKAIRSGNVRAELVRDGVVVHSDIYEFSCVKPDKLVDDVAGGTFQPPAVETPQPDQGWQRPPQGIALSTDRPAYVAGEEAVITIQANVQHGAGIVVIGDEHIYDAVPFELSNGTADVRVALKDLYAPRVFAMARLVGDGKELNSQMEIHVDSGLLLGVHSSVPVPRPKDRIELTIETKDLLGKPRPAEVSLGIIDERIYRFGKETTTEIRKAFQRSRSNEVSWRTYRRLDLGPGMSRIGGLPSGRHGDLLLGAIGPNPLVRSIGLGGRLGGRRHLAARGGGGVRRDDLPVRVEFPDTALWLPAIETDHNGRCIVEFKVPDSITSYRANLRGITHDGVCGEGRENIAVKQDFFVNLYCPRFFVAGDRSTVQAQVFNFTSFELDSEVQLEGEGFRHDAEHSHRRLTLQPHGSAIVEWPIHIVGRRSVQFRAVASGRRSEKDAPNGADPPNDHEFADAIALEVPVRIAGEEVREVVTGELSSREETVSLVLPPEAEPQTARLEVQLLPFKGELYGLLETVEFLSQFPYGCVEQTMSRFLPNIAVRDIFTKLNVSPGMYVQKLADMVAEGTNKLYNFQKADGGWGWFDSDPTDSFMTAYVVYGLKKAESRGFAVDSDRLRRGVACLKEMAAKETDRNKLAYMCFVLSLFGSEAEVSQSQPDDLTGLSPYALACRALEFNNTGKTDDAKRVLRLLEAAAISDARGTYWETANWYYKWEKVDVETTAYVLQAFVAIEPENPTIPEIVRWLLARRRGNKWGSTKDTAAAILALVTYFANSDGAILALSKAMESDSARQRNITQTGMVRLNGGPARKLAADLASPFESRTYQLFDPPELKPGENLLTFTIDTAAVAGGLARIKPGYVARLCYTLDYSRLYDVEARRQVQQPISQGFEISAAEELPGGKAKRHTEFEVALKVVAAEDSDFVLITSPIPAGCVIVSGSARGAFTFFEARDEKAVFFLRSLPKGEHHLRYSLHPRFAGTYSVLPPEAYMMYAETVRGRGVVSQIEIE